MKKYNTFTLVNGVNIHTKISKKVKTCIEGITKETKIPQCVIINHILTKELIVAKKPAVKKAAKPAVKKPVTKKK